MSWTVTGPCEAFHNVPAVRGHLLATFRTSQHIASHITGLLGGGGGVTQSNGAKLSLISLQQMWLLVCCILVVSPVSPEGSFSFQPCECVHLFLQASLDYYGERAETKGPWWVWDRSAAAAACVHIFAEGLPYIRAFISAPCRRTHIHGVQTRLWSAPFLILTTLSRLWLCYLPAAIPLMASEMESG